MYGTIAVGTDGSETATIAENVALQLATSSNGRVLFISAFTDGPSRRRSVEALERARANATCCVWAVSPTASRTRCRAIC